MLWQDFWSWELQPSRLNLLISSPGSCSVAFGLGPLKTIFKLCSRNIKIRYSCSPLAHTAPWKDTPVSNTSCRNGHLDVILRNQDNIIGIWVSTLANRGITKRYTNECFKLSAKRNVRGEVGFYYSSFKQHVFLTSSEAPVLFIKFI